MRNLQKIQKYYFNKLLLATFKWDKELLICKFIFFIFPPKHQNFDPLKIYYNQTYNPFLISLSTPSKEPSNPTSKNETLEEKETKTPKTTNPRESGAQPQPADCCLH